MLTAKAMTGGEGYAANHLSNSDYYAEGETVKGKWMGRGAELLGLEGEVTMQQFDAIRQAIDPATGEFLRQRQSADRYGEVTRNGETTIEKTGTGRNLYDFTVSAPKALSVLALEDPRAMEAHHAGVSAIAQELERLAGARIRKGAANAANLSRVTSNLVIARYDHTASRALDPQIHSHLVAGNLTYDGVEGKWKALDATEVYQQTGYLTEVYRNEAARVLNTLGYQTYDRFEHGKDNGFGIVGINEETLEKFSRRTAQKEAAIQQFIRENGRQPSRNEISQLVRETRDAKLTAISTAEVIDRQRARMTPEEVRTLQGLRETALERGSIRQTAAAAPSLAHATEHIFERVSVAKEHEVKAEALRHGRGRIELPELKAAIRSNVVTGALLTAGGEVATEQTLERERRMIAAINDGARRFEPLGQGHDFTSANRRLNDEQKAGLAAVLESRDWAINIQGAPGVGKTYMLQELQRATGEARISIIPVAPSARAVQELQSEGFPQAMTIARLLSDPKQQAQLAGQVLLVDEAGMVSSQDMSELLKLAKDQRARIIFSGDTRQIKSVGEGDALRILERESKLSRVSLVEVQRQRNPEYKAAVQALRTNPAEGYRKLEAMGVIREVGWREVGPEVSRAYREAAAVPNLKGHARSILVVARTHDQIKSISHAIREDRKAAGELGEGRTFEKLTALDWTEAQKRQMNRYLPGQVLSFHKAVHGVAKNESLEVISADRGGVMARKANGKALTFTGKQAAAYGVFEKEELEVSAGDKLLLQVNWKEKGKHGFKATNGELVTVASIDGGAIRLEDGRQLPAAYKQFTSGYAVTAHAGQGASVDFVIAAPDGMRRDLAEVTLTRGREGLTVVTSDALSLQESIGVSGDRQSATELASRAHLEADRTEEATPWMLLQHGAVRETQISEEFQSPAERLEAFQVPQPTEEISTHYGISY